MFALRIKCKKGATSGRSPDDLCKGPRAAGTCLCEEQETAEEEPGQ